MVRQHRALIGTNHDLVRVAAALSARKIGAADNPLTHLQVGDLAADFHHLACKVDAEHGWSARSDDSLQNPQWFAGFAHFPIHRIDTDGADRDAYFVGAKRAGLELYGDQRLSGGGRSRGFHEMAIPLVFAVRRTIVSRSVAVFPG